MRDNAGRTGRGAAPSMTRLRDLILPVSVVLLSAAGLAQAQAPTAVDERREKLRAKRERQFRLADTDQSRSLTRAEIEAGRLPSALLRQFERIDSDGDGALTPEELESAQQRRAAAVRTAGVQDSGD